MSVTKNVNYNLIEQNYSFTVRPLPCFFIIVYRHITITLQTFSRLKNEPPYYAEKFNYAIGKAFFYKSQPKLFSHVIALCTEIPFVTEENANVNTFVGVKVSSHLSTQFLLKLQSINSVESFTQWRAICGCVTEHNIVNLGEGYYPRYITTARCKTKTGANKFYQCNYLDYRVSIWKVIISTVYARVNLVYLNIYIYIYIYFFIIQSSITSL